MLRKENILLNQSFENKEGAIEKAGQLLVDSGYVKDNYIERMLERERVGTTYIGNYIAIPHGTSEGKEEILESGISILQVPAGVSFGDEVAKVVIAIAGKDNTHLDLLSNIAIICSEMANVEKIINASSEEEILDLFGGRLA